MLNSKLGGRYYLSSRDFFFIQHIPYDELVDFEFFNWWGVKNMGWYKHKCVILKCWICFKIS